MATKEMLRSLAHGSFDKAIFHVMLQKETVSWFPMLTIYVLHWDS